MGTAEWIQVGISVTYVGILVVMLFQYRQAQAQMRAAVTATAESSRQMVEAIEQARASAAATRELATDHARLVAQAAASAEAAKDAARAAHDANRIAVDTLAAEQRHRAEMRAAVAARVEAHLLASLRHISTTRALTMQGKPASPAPKAVARAQAELREVGPADQMVLGDAVRDLIALSGFLKEAHDAARNMEPRGPEGVIPVLEFVENKLHTCVVALARLGTPERPPPELAKLRLDAWNSAMLGDIG